MGLELLVWYAILMICWFNIGCTVLSDNLGPYKTEALCKHRADELEAELRNLDLQYSNSDIWFLEKVCIIAPEPFNDTQES